MKVQECLFIMSEQAKFSSQIDRELLAQLRKFAHEQERSISGVLTDAVREYLHRVRVRPAFRQAVDEVLDEHDELLSRLAK